MEAVFVRCGSDNELVLCVRLLMLSATAQTDVAHPEVVIIVVVVVVVAGGEACQMERPGSSSLVARKTTS